MEVYNAAGLVIDFDPELSPPAHPPAAVESKRQGSGGGEEEAAQRPCLNPTWQSGKFDSKQTLIEIPRPLS
jgi:hypothetical protein